MDKIGNVIHSSDILFDKVKASDGRDSTIERPGRYVGGEWNSIHKGSGIDYRVCLVFPDLYDIGMSYYGFQILYHILNVMDGISCERSFLPWLDMQRLIGQRKVSLSSIESGLPLSQFDLIGITLQTEMHYPGVLKILDLAGIPRYAEQRGDEFPLIIGGGPSAFHPEPVAPFFDVFLLGDGEEALPELIGMTRQGAFRKLSKRDKWQRIAELDGFYVPGLYRADPMTSRKIVPIDGAPPRVRARAVSALKSENYPVNPIVPSVRGEHDRLTVEIMRGCTQGCRFCQAGMIHRPLRERSVEDVIEQVMAGLQSTGWDEIGLLSLSTSDYSQLEPLLIQLTEKLRGKKATVGYPSLRPATFTEDIAAIDTGGRRSSLTFAVESGSSRMRDVINKNVTDEDLFTAVERAYRHGWSSVKLYFMVGLPTEKSDDIREAEQLLKKLERMVPRGKSIHFSVAPFIPKPHSVFEGEQFVDIDELWHRMRGMYRPTGKRWVKLSNHDPQRSGIEALLSRGDRRLAPVIEAIADEGDGFEGWGGHFSADRWYRVLGELLPDWRDQLKKIDVDEPRPWGHLSKGISPKFMRDDLKAAYSAVKIVDCRTDECYKCGLRKVCDFVEPIKVHASPAITEEASDATTGTTAEHYRYRLIFSKLWKARFLGHHDLMNAIERGLRRAGVPLKYKEGYSPKPKVSYGPAIPLGYGVVKHWLEFETSEVLNVSDCLRQLKVNLPVGVRPWSVQPIQRGEKTEQSVVRSYRLRFRGELKLKDTDSNSDPPQDIKAWRVDRHGRTLTLDLLPPKLGGARPEEAWRQLSNDKQENVKLLSVTRMD